MQAQRKAFRLGRYPAKEGPRPPAEQQWQGRKIGYWSNRDEENNDIVTMRQTATTAQQV